MAAPMPNPVIVVPGITASCLRDEYDLEDARVWALTSRRYERVALHPDDTRYERDLPARVRADRVFGVPYHELIEDLRHDLSPTADRPTPVHPFAYDWRQPLDDLENELGVFIDEVIERTALMPHYHEAGWHEAPSVDLVGHSMGGLIIAGLLASYETRVRKVVTIGTPFRGSLEAVIKITTGLSSIGGRSASREREVARVTPALYHLLPAFDGAVEADRGIPSSMFDPDAWQPAVVETIAEYVRLHGRDRALSRSKRKKAAGELFHRMLADAAAHLERVEGLELGAAGLAETDWLCIVGLGDETRLRLRITRDARGHPFFDLRSVDRDDLWTPDNSVRTTRTGDGTVPYLGARPAFLPDDRLVCVSDDDFGYWELGDRVLEGALGVGLHAMLPKMNVVQKLIVCHLTSGEAHAGVWGRRAPDLPLEAPWRPPIAGLRERTRG